MIGDKQWTVFAIRADTEEGYVTCVEAPDPHEAWVRVRSGAPAALVKAGIVSGRVEDVSDEPQNVIPIREHDAPITVSTVRVVEKQIMVPAMCPNCRSDLRRAQGVMQCDLARRVWHGHLVSDGGAVAAEKNQRVTDTGKLQAEATRLTCAMCGRALWDGLCSTQTQKEA